MSDCRCEMSTEQERDVHGVAEVHTFDLLLKDQTTVDHAPVHKDQCFYSQQITVLHTRSTALTALDKSSGC